MGTAHLRDGIACLALESVGKARRVVLDELVVEQSQCLQRRGGHRTSGRSDGRVGAIEDVEQGARPGTHTGPIQAATIEWRTYRVENGVSFVIADTGDGVVTKAGASD